MAIDESKIESIEERSPYFSEILEKIPSWIIRRGNLLFFIIGLLFLSGLYLIRYPDVVEAEVKILSSSPSIGVVCTQNGMIEHTLQKDKDQVTKGDWIVVLRSGSDYQHIQKLSQFLSQLETKDFWSILDTVTSENQLLLGDLTDEYLRFFRGVEEYQLFQRITPQVKQIEINKSRQVTINEVISTVSKQYDLLKEEALIVQADLARNQRLHESGSISLTQLEEKERSLLEIKSRLEQLNRSKLDLLLEQKSISKDNTALSSEKRERYFELRSEIITSYNALLTETESWINRFVLVAPIDGTLDYYEIRNENHFIVENQQLFTISPPLNQKFVGFAKMPVANSGKVQKGQTVLIKLHNYPHQEYGTVKGKLESITSVPKEELYTIKIALPNQLRTSSGKELEPRNELTGIAEIITEDKSLLNRIFHFVKL